MYGSFAARPSSIRLLIKLTLDSLSCRPHPNYWITKDRGLLCSATEVEGNGCLCGWYHFDSTEMASRWIWSGIVWYSGLVWGFLLDNW